MLRRDGVVLQYDAAASSNGDVDFSSDGADFSPSGADFNPSGADLRRSGASCVRSVRVSREGEPDLMLVAAKTFVRVLH